MYTLDQIMSGKRIRAPRIIDIGVEKVGKSSFAAGAPNPFFLPIKGEEGIDDLNVKHSPVCETFADVLGWLGYLYHEKHKFETVVIDSMSTLEPLIWAATCARHGVTNIEEVLEGFSKGYKEALTEWRILTDWLDALRNDRNMTVILIGHVEIGKVNEPPLEAFDTFLFDIHKKAAAQLSRWADSIVFCNYKTIVTKEALGFGKEKGIGVDMGGGDRFLFTRKTPAHPGGGRGVYGRLPDELPLNWPAYAAAIKAQIAAEKNPPAAVE